MLILGPPNVAYALGTFLTYTVNTVISTNTISSSTGGIVDSFSVTPSLPAGLLLDSGTGALSGVPTVVTARGTYVVSAINSGGSFNISLSIAVNDSKLMQL